MNIDLRLNIEVIEITTGKPCAVFDGYGALRPSIGLDFSLSQSVSIFLNLGELAKTF